MRRRLWTWVVWAVASLGVFGLLEWWGLRKQGDRDVPLTEVIREYVPAWLFAVVFGGFTMWFAFHILAGRTV